MNKYLIFVLSISSLIFSCSSSKKFNTLRVAATPIPQAQMLEYIKPELKDKGIELKIIVMDDYNLPNRALENGDVDANFFQHLPFLEKQIAQFHYNICSLTQVHIEPMGMYSRKIKNLDSLSQGAIIGIPNDPSNEARALILAQSAGLITLSSGDILSANTKNISSNPKNIQFKELDASMLGRSLPDVDIAIIPTNFALQAGLIPSKDALFSEKTDSPYVNVIAVRCENLNNPNLIALKDAMNSKAMSDFILTNFKGEILPAFSVKESSND